MHSIQLVLTNKIQPFFSKSPPAASQNRIGSTKSAGTPVTIDSTPFGLGNDNNPVRATQTPSGMREKVSNLNWDLTLSWS